MIIVFYQKEKKREVGLIKNKEGEREQLK